MLLRGFTTVRDTGGASKPLAQAIEEGLIEGPRLFQCGKALSQTGTSILNTWMGLVYKLSTGGHGDFTPGISGGDTSTGCCGGHSKSLGRVVDGVPQVLKATREELKAGADCRCAYTQPGVVFTLSSHQSHDWGRCGKRDRRHRDSSVHC